jgi:hypothetical protein
LSNEVAVPFHPISAAFVDGGGNTGERMTF